MLNSVTTTNNKDGHFGTDDVSFYNQRYMVTRTSVGNLLSMYGSDRAFSARSIYGVSYDMKLNNLKAYGESNGCVNDGLEAISTDVYRVNRNHREPSKYIFGNEDDYLQYSYFVC